MKGKMINVVFEEIPLFAIQILIITHNMNIDRNTQSALLIALGSTILGMVLNTVIWITNEWNSDHSRMRLLYVRVINPTADLRFHEIGIKRAADLYYKVFAYRLKKEFKETVFRMEFAYDPVKVYDIEGRIRGALEKYSDENTQIFMEVEPTMGLLIDELEELNHLISHSGHFRYRDRKFEITFENVDEDLIGCLSEMMDTGSLEKWNSIKDIAQERTALETSMFEHPETSTMKEIALTPCQFSNLSYVDSNDVATTPRLETPAMTYLSNRRDSLDSPTFENYTSAEFEVMVTPPARSANPNFDRIGSGEPEGGDVLPKRSPEKRGEDANIGEGGDIEMVDIPKLPLSV